jgi:hypothetical protein
MKVLVLFSCLVMVMAKPEPGYSYNAPLLGGGGENFGFGGGGEESNEGK